MGRGREFETLIDAADDLRRGRGRLFLIEGPPGIGKTALLDAAAHRFAAIGLRTCRARAAELELAFPYGVVRQLFVGAVRETTADVQERLFEGAAALAAPVLRDPAALEPTEDGADVAFARLHGLYWFCANLAELRPVVILVDDAQWCDAGSLRFLDFLARRVPELPIAIVISARDGMDRGPDGELERLLEHATTEVVRVPALTPEQSAAFIELELGEQPAEPFHRSSHTVTGGNPLLLRELIREVRVRGLRPDERGARQVASLHPSAISRMVEMRLRRFSAHARTIAEAVAVLGEDVPVSDVTAYAELPDMEDDEQLVEALDELVTEQILSFEDGRVRYFHPIVRAAVYGRLSPRRRAEAHRKAAAFLRERRDPERLAAHLLECPALGLGWVAGTLIETARQALRMGAPDSARRYLKRALAENAPATARVPLLLELATVEGLIDRADAEHRLHGALAEAADPVDRFRAATALGASLYMAGRGEDAHDMLCRALELAPSGDRDARLAVEAQLRLNAHVNGYLEPAELERALDLAEPARDATSPTPVEAGVLACWTIGAAVSGRLSATECVRYARASLSAQPVHRRNIDAYAFFAAVQALTYSDALDEVAGVLDLSLADAQHHGSGLAFAHACWARSGVNLRRGRLLDAEADAVAAVEGLKQGDWLLRLPRAVAALAEALVARGDLAAARSALDDLGDWSQYATRSVQHLHYVRGSLWLALGNPAGAAADLLACGRLIAPWERDFPARLSWRSSAALALAELGQFDHALELSEAELRAARRFGAPRALGIALRCRGEIDKTDFGTAALEEAVSTLEGSDARLEYAQALSALGRRLGKRRPEAARELLSRALDLADRCGAELAFDLKQALVEAGARPRRSALEGLASLTASERRIAGMAATGMSNKAIAQALFVTTKTVEMHLGNTYRKLGIRSRQDLPETLAVDGAAA